MEANFTTRLITLKAPTPAVQVSSIGLTKFTPSVLGVNRGSSVYFDPRSVVTPQLLPRARVFAPWVFFIAGAIM